MMVPVRCPLGHNDELPILSEQGVAQPGHISIEDCRTCRFNANLVPYEEGTPRDLAAAAS